MTNKSNKLKRFSKFLLKGLVRGALLAGAALLVLESPQIHHNYIINKVGPSVVMITNVDANSGGTGFAVKAPSGKDYILTNAHICVGVQRPLIVTFKDNRKVPLRIVEVSKDTDLCLIEPVGNLEGLSLADSLEIGQNIAIVGHPALMDITLAKGELIQKMDIAIPVPESLCETSKEIGGPFVEVDNPFFPCVGFIKGVGQTNAVIIGGSSGSPVINFFGNLVGVAFAGRGDTNWALIIPLSHVEQFLKPY